MKKQNLVIVFIVVIVLIVAGIFYFPNLPKKPAFIGEKTVEIKTAEIPLLSNADAECKRICEETAKVPCHNSFEVCKEISKGQVNGAGGLLWGCNQFYEQNPEALKEAHEKYPCQYYIGQTAVGSDTEPCAFSCK